jgi:hypothetical protein
MLLIMIFRWCAPFCGRTFPTAFSPCPLHNDQCADINATPLPLWTCPNNLRKPASLINLKDIKKRAWQEIAPQPLSSEDIKRALIKPSHDSYKFTMEQWS